MTKRRRKKTRGISLWLLFASLIVGAVGVDVFLATRQLGGADAWIPDPTPYVSTEETPTALATATPTSTGDLPAEALVAMPFLVQAPFAKWDALHEDACEETSLIMVKHFLAGDTSIAKQAGDTEIINTVHWEESKGYGLSITLNELNEIAANYMGMSKGRVVQNISIDDIKREIAAGNPVIVGAAGKVLENSHFSGDGPNYHMLVIKGYDSKGFITNDPGIREGENFRYSYQNMDESIHDWDPTNILNGQKSYLVFER